MTGPRQIQVHDGENWVAVLPGDRLTPGRGVAVLVGGHQVAVFADRVGALYAVDNRDPFSGAHVMSRGILGSRGTAPVVISPMYKQNFDLRTGCCLDEATAPDGGEARLRTWPVRVAPPAPASPTEAVRP